MKTMKYSDYQKTKPYQNMDDGQKAMMDHIENTGFYRGNARREIERWQRNRENMTPEELQTMEEKNERDRKRGTWWLVGFGIIVLVIAGVFLYGEMTSNPLAADFTGL